MADTANILLATAVIAGPVILVIALAFARKTNQKTQSKTDKKISSDC